MSWVESFSLVMRSSLTALREKMEDPERLLNQLIIDMDDELIHVRESVAAAIADEILLKNRLDQARDTVQQWDDRAAQAVSRGDERQARAALEHKLTADAEAESLAADHETQQEQTADLQGSVGELEEKIRQARRKRTLLLARLARAESTQKIQDALQQTASDSAFAQFGRLERRVERAEAMTQAYERLDGRDPEAESLDREFAARERQDQVEAQLADLKRRVQEAQ